jgi:hypothetical protein
MNKEHQWNENIQGITEVSCPSATLSATHPTYSAMRPNLAFRSKKPAASSMRYVTVLYHLDSNTTLCFAFGCLCVSILINTFIAVVTCSSPCGFTWTFLTRDGLWQQHCRHVLILSYSRRDRQAWSFYDLALEAQKLVLISVQFLPRRWWGVCERSLKLPTWRKIYDLQRTLNFFVPRYLHVGEFHKCFSEPLHRRAKRALKLAHITVQKKKSPSRVVTCSPVGSAWAIRCQSTVWQRQRGVSTTSGPAPSCQVLGYDWCCHGDRSASKEVGRALAPLCLEEAGLFMNGFSGVGGGEWRGGDVLEVTRLPSHGIHAISCSQTLEGTSVWS